LLFVQILRVLYKTVGPDMSKNRYATDPTSLHAHCVRLRSQNKAVISPATPKSKPQKAERADAGDGLRRWMIGAQMVYLSERKLRATTFREPARPIATAGTGERKAERVERSAAPAKAKYDGRGDEW